MASSTMKILNCSEIFFKKWNIQELFFETETLFSFSTYILVWATFEGNLSILSH